MKKKILAVLLTMTLAVSGPGTVMANPVTGEQTVSSQEAVAGEQSAPETGKETLDAEPEAGKTETPEIQAPETVSGEEIPEIAGVSENDPAAGDTQNEGEEDPAGGTVSENVPVAVSEEEELAKALENVPLMLSSLNEEESSVYERFSSLKAEEADEIYDADEAFFEAETEEEAEKIAAAYGAKLVSFQYGIATMRFDLQNRDLSNVLLRKMYTANFRGNTDEIIEADIWPNYIDNILEEPTDSIYTADPDYGKQWYHSVIRDNEAWSSSNKGNGAVVCVIDTGVDTDHPDLKDNLIGAYETLEDGNSPEDEHSHGTHCLGIIGAVENNVGGVGVAPKAKLVSIRAANAKGQFKNSDVVAAIYLAIDLNVDVISMSFGGHRPENALEKKALEEAVKNGITLIAAAGNETTDDKSMPAAYEFVTAVASYDKGDTLSYFSNYGSWVDIAAPGGNIYSTVLNGDYGYKSGTSMACPVVSGVTALIYASDDEFKDKGSKTVEKVREILLGTKNRKKYTYDVNSVVGGVEPYPAVNYLKDAAVTVDVPSKPGIETETDPKTGAITVTATADAAEIRYTTDGSIPNVNSKKYSAPFRLTEEGNHTVNVIAINKAKISTGYKTATSDVANKKITVKLPAKAEYDDNELSIVTDFNGTISLVAGKSVKLTGTVLPSNSSKKALVFEKTGGSDSITVNANGTVTAAKTAAAGDSAVVKISIKDCPDAASVNVNVKISGNDPTGQVTSGYGKTVQELYTTAVNSEMKTSLDATAGLDPAFGGSVAYSFKSSNEKIAKVDNKGRVTAVGNGNATIKVTALDGSNKNVSIKVKCMTPVTGMSLVSTVGQPGSSRIGVGSSITLQPVLTGYKNLAPSNKKVSWSTESTFITVNKSGKVTCAKDATVGNTAKVYCTATDGSGISAVYEFKVGEKTKFMGIIKSVNPIIKKYKKTKYIVGYTNVYATSMTADNVVQTAKEIDVTSADGFVNVTVGPVCSYTNKYYTYNDTVTEKMDPADYIVSISNSKNVLVLQSDTRGSVQKISVSKPGTVSVVYTAVDGSNKKFTLKIKVKN